MKFKKSPKDLKKEKEKEHEDKYNNMLSQVIKQKQECQQRTNLRKLERDIISYKANQAISPEKYREISLLEEQDPLLFEELSLKMRWSNTSKDPSKYIKDQALQVSNWGFVSHLPPSKVGKIVTDKVLQLDQQSCKQILGKILQEKRHEDQKLQIQQQERHSLREKLKQAHNATLELEERIGVKTSYMSKRENTPTLTAISENVTTPFYEKSYQQYLNNQTMLSKQSKMKPHTQQIISGQKELQKAPNNFSFTNINVTPEFNQTQIYNTHNNSCSTQKSEVNGMKLKFTEPKQYNRSSHLENLAMNKPEYQSKDFFSKADFRGLFLADYQEAIGEKAFSCVEELNQKILSQFKTLNSFNEQIQQRKQIQQYYKQELIPKLRSQSKTIRNKSQNTDYSFNSTKLPENLFSLGQNTIRSTSQHTQVRGTAKNADKSFNDIYNYSKNMFESFKDNNHSKTIRENSETITSKQGKSFTSQKQRRNLSTLQSSANQLEEQYNPYIQSKGNKLSNYMHQIMNDNERTPIAQTQQRYATAAALGVPPNAEEYFEAPFVEIAKFDRRFPKNGNRQFKYPNIELSKIPKTLLVSNEQPQQQP